MENRRDEPRRRLLNANITKEVEDVILILTDEEKDRIIKKYYLNFISKNNEVKYLN